jgi:hypothetical protein
LIERVRPSASIWFQFHARAFSLLQGLADAQAYALLALIFFCVLMPIGFLRRTSRAIRSQGIKPTSSESFFIKSVDGEELVKGMERPF